MDGRRNAESTAWARVQFGNFYFNRGDRAGARAQYAAALETFPGYTHALAASARVAAADGEYDAAISLLREVTERQPLPEHVALLGDVYAADGQPGEAQRQYDLIGAIDELYRSNGITTDLQMSLFFADHDIRIGDAVQGALAVYAATPDSIYAADAVAWALYKAGQPDEALPYAKDALRLGTADAMAYYHAGMINAALGNDDLAREQLTRALEINPAFSVLQAPVAREAREALGQ
jgi:tetratricopeptide (TPR) repeat protein